MPTKLKSSPYGSRGGTGAASIDIVIKGLPVGREFTVAEIEREVRRRGLPTRGAVYEHLKSLLLRDHVQQTNGGWCRVD